MFSYLVAVVYRPQSDVERFGLLAEKNSIQRITDFIFMRIIGTYGDGRVMGDLSQHKQSDSISAFSWNLIVLLRFTENLSPIHSMVVVGSSSDVESSSFGKRAFGGRPAEFSLSELLSGRGTQKFHRVFLD